MKNTKIIQEYKITFIDRISGSMFIETQYVTRTGETSGKKK